MQTTFPVSKKLVFAEQVDYVMEIDDGKNQENKVVLVNVNATEEKQKNAFKKKLRKYSCLI